MRYANDNCQIIQFPRERIITTDNYRMGHNAFYRSVPYTLNPFNPDNAPKAYSDWQTGWMAAQWEGSDVL